MKNDVVEAVIEIPYRSRNKYEEDEDGKIKLNRVLYSAMGYPTEYGTIEKTLAPDGDPLDILVIATEPTYPGCIVPARVVGYLDMSDDGKGDYKLISVVDCDPRYDNIHELEDVPEFTLSEIKNFFENYKQLQNIEVEVRGFHNKEEALKLYEDCKKAYNER
jgi:inorganic pyrophosphatase